MLTISCEGKFALKQILRFWSSFVFLVAPVSYLMSIMEWKPWTHHEFIAYLFVGSQVALWIPVLFYHRFPKPIPRNRKAIVDVQKVPLWRAFLFALLNHVLLSSVLGQMCFFHYTFAVGPSSFTDILTWFTRCTILTDGLFTSTHLIFHRSSLYRYHKLHHEVIFPFGGLETVYVHPIEHVLVNVLPFSPDHSYLRPCPLGSSSCGSPSVCSQQCTVTADPPIGPVWNFTMCITPRGPRISGLQGCSICSTF